MRVILADTPVAATAGIQHVVVGEHLPAIHFRRGRIKPSPWGQTRLTESTVCAPSPYLSAWQTWARGANGSFPTGVAWNPYAYSHSCGCRAGTPGEDNMRLLWGFILLAIAIGISVLYFRPRKPSSKMTAPTDGQVPDGLTIQRVRTYTDALRSYRVLLDGEEVASLKNGRAVTLDVPPGEHRLEVEIAFMNAVLDFAMTDKPKRVLVGRGLAAGGNAFTPPIIVEA